MKKILTLVLVLCMIFSLFIVATASAEEPLKIAYLVSDMKETFHQASYEAAKAYAAEKYGAEVIAFDGAGDAADQIAMLDQFAAQGIDMATMHVWENEAALPALRDLLDEALKDFVDYSGAVRRGCQSGRVFILIKKNIFVYHFFQ